MYTHIVGHYVLNRNSSKCKYEKITVSGVASFITTDEQLQ